MLQYHEHLITPVLCTTSGAVRNTSTMEKMKISNNGCSGKNIQLDDELLECWKGILSFVPTMNEFESEAMNLEMRWQEKKLSGFYSTMSIMKGRMQNAKSRAET